MLGGAVKGERFIVVRSGRSTRFPISASVLAMVRCPIMSGTAALLLLAKRQKPRCELPRNVAIEVYEIDDPLAKEGREQQRRVIGRFSEPFRLLDQRSLPELPQPSFRARHIL